MISSSLDRVRNYVHQRTGRRGLDPDLIHGLDIGTKSEAELNLSDMRAVLNDYDAMRAICGPRCPKCGAFFWVQKTFRREWTDDELRIVEFQRGSCRITVEELRRDHPEIAKELGL